MQSRAAKGVFLEHVQRVALEALWLQLWLKLVRRLRPKFLQGAYFSNTYAKYSAASDVTAAVPKIGVAAAASEVSARGVFLEQMCKVQRWKRCDCGHV